MNKTPIAAFAADIHWMTRTPEYRRETCPFNEVIAAKLATFAAYLRKHGIPGFMAGDTFDISRSFNDWWTLREVLHERGMFFPPGRSGALSLCVVAGQHDRFHHNPNDKMTSLNALLSEEDGLRLMDRRGYEFEPDLCTVYGAGWGDEIPVPTSHVRPNILVLHKTLWNKTPIYPGQVEGNIVEEAKKLRALGYDMVFSGDNHKAFDVTVGGVEFHNIGAFTRQDVTLVNQQPRFMVLFDDMSVESVYVGEKDVFDMGRSDAEKGREDTKDGFSEALAGGFEYGATFKGSLETMEKIGKCAELVFTEPQRRLLRDIINAI